MPKETFYNLPEEKVKRIEKAAIKEFKEYNFDASSINRIVDNSGISKGSFYQYFEDKKDLYKHIMGLVVERKLDYMSNIMANPFNYDFFTLIREMYKTGLNFARENPDLVEIGNKLIGDPSHAIYKEIIEENKGKSDKVFELLLQKAMERGEIREGIDIKMAAFLLTTLNVSIVDYYSLNKKKREYNKEMLEIIEKFLDFVQYGISTKGEKK